MLAAAYVLLLFLKMVLGNPSGILRSLFSLSVLKSYSSFLFDLYESPSLTGTIAVNIPLSSLLEHPHL